MEPGKDKPELSEEEFSAAVEKLLAHEKLMADDHAHYCNARSMAELGFSCRVWRPNESPEISRQYFEKAKAEFDQISLEAQRWPAELKLAAWIHRGLENWGELAATAAELARLFPDESRWVVDLAHGMRHSVSIEAARDILTAGKKIHPGDADIEFQLAGLEAQLGNIEKGRQHLSRAAADSAAMGGRALHDPDVSSLLEGLTADEMLTLLHLPITGKAA